MQAGMVCKDLCLGVINMYTNNMASELISSQNLAYQEGVRKLRLALTQTSGSGHRKEIKKTKDAKRLWLLHWHLDNEQIRMKLNGLVLRQPLPRGSPEHSVTSDQSTQNENQGMVCSAQ